MESKRSPTKASTERIRTPNKPSSATSTGSGRRTVSRGVAESARKGLTSKSELPVEDELNNVFESKRDSGEAENSGEENKYHNEDDDNYDNSGGMPTSAGDEEVVEDRRKDNIFDVVDPTPTPLIQAIQTFNVLEVKRAIQSVPIELRLEAIDQVPPGGVPAIFYTLDPENLDIFRLLLDYGADPNARDFRMNSPLHMCAQNQNKEAMRLLIFHGGNPIAENGEHLLPHDAVKSDQLRASTQGFINECYSKWKDAIKAKTVFVIPPEMRCYYRSMFDLVDYMNTGIISMHQIVPLLESIPIPVEDEINPLDPELIAEWFHSIDKDHNGHINFSEFLQGIMQHSSDQDKAKKKQGKGSKKKKKASNK